MLKSGDQWRSSPFFRTPSEHLGGTPDLGSDSDFLIPKEANDALEELETGVDKVLCLGCIELVKGVVEPGVLEPVGGGKPEVFIRRLTENNKNLASSSMAARCIGQEVCRGRTAVQPQNLMRRSRSWRCKAQKRKLTSNQRLLGANSHHLACKPSRARSKEAHQTAGSDSDLERTDRH